MLPHGKTAIAACIAAIALSLALTATAANARNLSFSEREFEILFRELDFEIAGNHVRCPVTLLGHFLERTIPKTGQAGVIRHVEPAQGAEPPCVGGTITVPLETLPWRVNYVSFTGTLPNITRIRLSLIEVAFRFSTMGLACLIRTERLKPAFGELLVGALGGITGFRFDETVGIPSAGFVCELAGEFHFSGTGTVLNLPQNRSITVLLI